MKFKLSIVIPTFQEAKNINKLVILIYKNIKLKLSDFELIIIDDNSKDGIIEIINILKKQYSNLKIVVRFKKPRDLSKSCIYGFNLSKFDNVLVMDADLQHNPIYLKKMISNFCEKKIDILIGCRKFNTTSKNNIPYMRFWSSKLIIYCFNYCLGFKSNDPLSGFFIFKKKIYKSNKKKLFSSGYKILADLLYNSKNNLIIKDLYINFNKRHLNKSKMNFRTVVLLLRFFLRQLLQKK